MIALNETNEYAAEVAFTLFSGLTPITGWSFTLGEVQIKLPGGSWTNVALNKIVEKGYGRYCARLTSSQTATAGDVYIKAIVSGAQNYFGSDVISELGGDIPVGGAGSLNFYLPDATDPYNNPPLTGVPGTVFAVGDVRVCLPDATYADVDIADIEEIGYGLYRVNLDASSTTKRGKVFVHAEVTGYQAFEGYNTILGVGASPSVIAPPPTPVTTPVTVTSSLYNNHLKGAFDRLPVQFRSGIVYEDITFAEVVS